MLVAQSCPTLCNPMEWDSSVRQAPLSWEFSRQEYWSACLFPSLGELPDLGIKPCLLQCRHILYYLSHQGSPDITLSAREIVEMSGKFKLCFLEYHGIFSPNIFYASIEFTDMQIQRVDCIFFSPNIKFLKYVISYTFSN